MTRPLHERMVWDTDDIVIVDPKPPKKLSEDDIAYWSFADVPRDEVALAGKDGTQAAKLLGKAKEAGTKSLYYVMLRAVNRLMRSDDPMAARRLFDADELITLADQLAATNATADLLGRSRVRERASQAERKQKGEQFAEDSFFVAFADPPPPLPPTEAIEYFKGLVPDLAVKPETFGAMQRRRAFTMALKSDETMLKRVQSIIGEALESGQVSGATADIEEVLNRAGVTPANPQYSELVWRTNAMESYNVGAAAEMANPDMQDIFPCWEYLGIDDGRQGDDHAPNFCTGGPGNWVATPKYYSPAVTFAQVRGDRVWNCRCGFRPVDKYEWKELQAEGAKLESGW